MTDYWITGESKGVWHEGIALKQVQYHMWAESSADDEAVYPKLVLWDHPAGWSWEEGGGVQDRRGGAGWSGHVAGATAVLA